MTDREALEAIAEALSCAPFDCTGDSEFRTMDWFYLAAKLLVERGYSVVDYYRHSNKLLSLEECIQESAQLEKLIEEAKDIDIMFPYTNCK